MKTGEKVRGLLRLIGVAANLQRSTANVQRSIQREIGGRLYLDGDMFAPASDTRALQ